jgi:hypothetical protein
LKEAGPFVPQGQHEVRRRQNLATTNLTLDLAALL